MPGGDRTGPMGAGPRTGRAAGFCAGYGMPGYMHPGFGWGRGFGFGGGFGFGRGMGFGRGGGRGWRNRYYATGVPGWPFGKYGYRQPGWEEGSPEDAMPPEEDRRAELAELKEQSKYVQETLIQINRRIEEIEKKIET